jgi:hypothetical protein
VFTELSERVAEFLSNMNVHKSSRKHAVDSLGNQLFALVEKHKTYLSERNACPAKCKWLAHQIIADIEEMFEDPFGPVTPDSIEVGIGSKQGLAICYGSMSRYIEDENSSTSDRLSNTLIHVLSILQQDSREGMLFRTIFCVRKESVGNRIVIALNGRALNETDAEHFLCKVYIGASKCLSSRSSSAHPISNKAGHHPVSCLGTPGLPWDEENVDHLMTDSWLAYRVAATTNIIRETPDCCLVYGESDVFNTT